LSAAAAAPMVCRSPPAQNARPSPSITSTLISSDASTSAPSCSSFLAIDRSIETVTGALRDRLGTLVAALGRELPHARFTPPDGGYFLWIDLPENVDVDALFTAAQDRGVVFVKGTDFLLDGGRNSLRLAYSGVSPDEINEGVTRLATAYRVTVTSSLV